MQAIEYIVRDDAGILQHGALIESGISDTLTLGQNGAVSLNIGRDQVREYVRAGEDLELYLADGRKIVLSGFFADNGVQENHLYLNEDGALVEASVDAHGRVSYAEAASWGKWSDLDGLVFPDDPMVVADAGADIYADGVVAGDEEVSQALGLGLLGAGGGVGAAALPIAGAVGGLGLIGSVLGGGDGDDGDGGNGGGGGGDKTYTPSVDDTAQVIGGGDTREVIVTGTGTPGSTVEVVIGGKTVTTTIGDDGEWSASFTGGNVPADGDYDASVTITEEGGKVINLDGPNVFIDQTAPDVDVTYGTQSTGVTVNRSDRDDGVEISGQGEAGASLSVTIAGVTHTTTVGADGSWTVNFATGEIPTGKYEANVTIRSTDGYNNTTTVTETLSVDTTASVEFSATPVAGDGIVNEGELPSGVTLTGTAQPGSAVMVQMVGGNSYPATVAVDGSWTVTFPAGDFTAGEYDAEFTATATSPAGNTATASHTVEIDTLVRDFAQDANATIDDGVLNAADVAGGLTLTGTTEPGASVTISLGGTTKTMTVGSDGAWSFDFTTAELPSGETTTQLVVSSTDLAGNTSSLTQNVIVDTVAGDVALSSAPIELDDVINAVESSDGVIVTGTATSGMDVTVTLHGVEKVVTASPTGEWSAVYQANEVTQGDYTANITASITDQYGNSKTVSDTVEVDTFVDNHSITAGNIAGDNVINAVELDDGVLITGTVEIGSTVMVQIGSNAAVPATVDGSGNWSVNFGVGDIQHGDAGITVTSTDPAGNVDVLTKDIEVDTIVTNHAITSTEGTNGDVVNGAEAADGMTFTGTTEPGSIVHVTFNGITHQATVDANGNWDVDFEGSEMPTEQGDFTLTVAAQDPAGNSASATEVIAVDAEAPDAPLVTAINQGTNGLREVNTLDDEGTTVVQQLNSDGSITEVAYDLEVDAEYGELVFDFDAPLADGTQLVFTKTDAAGNQSSTLMLTNDGVSTSFDLSNAGLDGFQIEAVDMLQYSEDSTLTITEADLLAASSNSNELTIHGGSGDTVNAAGAVDTNTTETINGQTYEIYTLGTEGVLYIQEDVNVNTSVV